MGTKNVILLFFILFASQSASGKPSEPLKSAEQSVLWDAKKANVVFDRLNPIGNLLNVFQKCSRNSPKLLELNCTVYSLFNDKTEKLCDITVTDQRWGENEKKGEIVPFSIEKLGWGRLILQWYKLNKKREFVEMIVHLLNIENCKMVKQFYQVKIDSEPSNQVIIYNDHTFDLIWKSEFSNQIYKESHTYEGVDYRYELEEFPVKLEKMHIDAAGRNLFVRGFDPEKKLNKLVRYNQFNGAEDLMELSGLETVSWSGWWYHQDYVICNVAGRSEKSTDVNCSLFQEKSKVKKSYIVNFAEAVKPVAVRMWKGEIVLLTKPMNCQSDECWKQATLTRVLESKDGKRSLTDAKKESLECSGDMEKLNWHIHYDGADRKYVLKFICENATKQGMAKLNTKVVDWALELGVSKNN